MVASKDLFYHATGLLNTPEELEKERLELARNVRGSMRTSADMAAGIS